MKKILISQPKPSSDKSPYYDIEKEYGVECVFRPFFKVEGLTSKEFRQQKVNLLDYTAVVFTSRHAIDNYFKLAKEMRITIPEDLNYGDVFDDLLTQYTTNWELISAKTTNMGSLFKLSYRVTLADTAKEKEFMDALRCRNGNLEISIARQEANMYEL